MSDVAISVRKLGKVYRVRERERCDMLRDALTRSLTGPFGWRRNGRQPISNGNGSSVTPGFKPQNRSPQSQQYIWALKDVSFEIKRGEVIGIIGRNGAGKSTLLKILSRITEPTEGEARVYGRIGSLLEVGTGFHAELTGRENIYLNGTILGMKKPEIDRKFDEIVSFAEVGKFLETPVKRYSSGMYTRLAFSVAAHLDPEILVVDEVLAVGDAVFQKKCLGKMGEVAKKERTVFFVSHSMSAIAQLCTRVLWIHEGQLRLIGSGPDVIGSYLSFGTKAKAFWTNSRRNVGTAGIDIRAARVLPEASELSGAILFGQPFRVEIGYEVVTPIRNLAILCRLTDAQGTILWTSWDTDTTDWNGRVRAPGRYSSTCHIPGGWLRPGSYWLSVGTITDGAVLLDYHDNVLAFEISEVGCRLNASRLGVVTPLFEWEIKAT
jgi:lipopolysaccharide transport system ATP-binding protein